MKVLITGAAGYVGSVCAEALIERGHSVIALDDLSEGHRAAVDPRARFCQVNLHDQNALDEVFGAMEIDAVMHFAALCLVEHSVKEPGRYYRANVSAGINLLDAMLRHRVKKLIFSSTAATYGEIKTELGASVRTLDVRMLDVGAHNAWRRQSALANLRIHHRMAASLTPENYFNQRRRTAPPRPSRPVPISSKLAGSGVGRTLMSTEFTPLLLLTKKPTVPTPPAKPGMFH